MLTTVTGSPDSTPIDLGLSHVALVVQDLDASIVFYRQFAEMHVVHQRHDEHSRVAWISDLTRPFVIVLIQSGAAPHAPLNGWAHLGVACHSRSEVDERCNLARAQGYLVQGPADDGPPVGYWAFIADPDGHNLELSFGQHVGVAVGQVADHDSHLPPTEPTP